MPRSCPKAWGQGTPTPLHSLILDSVQPSGGPHPQHSTVGQSLPAP